MLKDELRILYFMIDEVKFIVNLEIVKYLKEILGVKMVLVLKCFLIWGVFDIIKFYLDGIISLGLFEVKLGYEIFGGEIYVYLVGYSEEDVKEVIDICDKMIFNL